MGPNSNTLTTKPADQLTATEPATQSKSNKPLLATTIITSILALAGIGAGVYFFMDSNNKSTEISDLNNKIASLNSQINSNQSTTTPDSANTESTGTTTTVVNAKNYGFTTDNFIGSYTETITLDEGNTQTFMANTSAETLFGAKVSLYADGTVKMSINGNACNYYNNACDNYHFEKDITSLIPGRAVDISPMQFGNGGTSWIFFILEDGTAASIWEFDAVEGKPGKIIEGSQDMIHLFDKYIQDSTGKIYTISPVIVDGEISGFKIDK